MRRISCLAAVTATVSALVSAATLAACSSSDKAARTKSTNAAPTFTERATSVPETTPVNLPPATPDPAKRDRVILHGNATLDGAAFNSRWVGAVVLRDGLVTPCQTALPPVTNGRYSVSVFAATESSGCGSPGARIALWTFAHDKIFFSTDSVSWPEDSKDAAFAPRYSTSDPAGAAPETAQFNGGVFRADRRPFPPGTRVEAYVGSTRCGVASVRRSDDFTGYILAVVGPDSIPGCTRGAALAFRVDGRPATSTKVVNTPPGQDETLDLSVS